MRLERVFSMMRYRQYPAHGGFPNTRTGYSDLLALLTRNPYLGPKEGSPRVFVEAVLAGPLFTQDWFAAPQPI